MRSPEVVSVSLPEPDALRLAPKVPCPKCGASINSPCVRDNGSHIFAAYHPQRLRDAVTGIVNAHIGDRK